MSGELFWRLVQLYDASRKHPTQEAWKSAWFKGSPPDVSLSTGLTDPAFVRPRSTEREVDPSTMRKSDEDDASEDVFSSPEWIPHFPSWNGALQPAVHRIQAVHLVTADLARLVHASDLRFKVLNLWNDPKKLSIEKDGRDTPTSVLEALFDLFKDGGAPSVTPLAADTDHLAADRFVKDKNEALDIERIIFSPSFLTAPRTWGIGPMEHFLSNWVGQRLFAEKHPVASWRFGLANSIRITTRAKDATLLYETLAKSFRGAEPRTYATLPSAIWKLETEGFELLRSVERRLIEAAGKSLVGLDAKLLAALTTGAHGTLRSYDTIEPIVKDSSTARVLEGALARVRIATEQRAAQVTLASIKSLLIKALNDWDAYSYAPIFDAFETKLRGRIDEVATEKVAGIKGSWKEKHTKRRFGPWIETALELIPSITARIQSYRDIVEKIDKISLITSDEPDEASSSLAEPRTGALNKGKKLFGALIALRDLLLPTIGSKQGRARLVGLVDALMGAHMAWVAERNDLFSEWASIWQGKLSNSQVEALVTGGTVQGWFKPISVAWSFKASDIVESGPDPKLRPPARESVYGEVGTPHQKWAEPVGTRGWSYWVTKQAPSTLDHDMLQGVSPRDPALEGALDTSFHVEGARVAIATWVWNRYETTGGVPDLPIERVAVMEVARAFYQYLWPILENDYQRFFDRIEKLRERLNKAATGTGKPRLSKEDKKTIKGVDDTLKKLFGKSPGKK